MAAGVVIKHKRKAGAFVDGELQSGEKGLDVTTGGKWWFSRNGTTVETDTSAGDMTRQEFASNGAPSKVDTSINSEQLGGVAASLYAQKTYADNAASAAVAAVIDASPAALDTLNELASALGDDANFSTTITNALAGKAPLTHQHNAVDINAGDLAMARMQSNVAAALQAGGGTISTSSLVLDGGTI